MECRAGAVARYAMQHHAGQWCTKIKAELAMDVCWPNNQVMEG